MSPNHLDAPLSHRFRGPSSQNGQNQLTDARARHYPAPMPNRSGRGSSGARSLDELDRAIIKQLQENGRRAYAGMARDLGVPEATVRQRTERLVDRGVVQIVGVTDPLAMGFRQPAFIGMTVDANRIEEIAEQIAALDEVTYLVITAGRFDLVCELVCRDSEHLLEVLSRRLGSIDGIRSTETLVELRIVKETYQWGTMEENARR